MRFIVSFFCVLVICSGAIANELVVGEQGSVSITLPNQPNNQKCNIEVKFADGSSQDVEVDPKNPSTSVSFTPTIAGTQVIQWDGKMKWRGLKSRPPCEGDGNVSVTVRERAEVLAEREAETFKLGEAAYSNEEYRSALEIFTPLAEKGNVRAQTYLGLIFWQGGDGTLTDLNKAGFWYAQAASQGDPVGKAMLPLIELEIELKSKQEATAKRNKQILDSLFAQLDTYEKKQCAVEGIKLAEKYGLIDGQHGITDVQSFESTLMNYYLTGDNPGVITTKTNDGFKLTLDGCNQFFAKERSWDSQTFEPPTGDISCTLSSGANSVCYWTYMIYVNDAWQDGTPLQAIQAHLEGGETYWTTALPEKPEAKARREKREADLARQQAQECKRNPLSYQTCPGYKEAEAERDAELAKQAAEEQRRKQERLARQRAEEEKERKRIAKERASMKFIFESDIDMAIQQETNRILGKQLNTSRGENVLLSKVYVWSADSSDWLNGGKLHLFNDYSLGTSMKVTCSISPSQGDKWMEKNTKRDVEMTGKIVSYSTRNGLVISPCKIRYLN